MDAVDALLARAREQTGLSDFGAESFLEGLRCLLEGAEASGALNDAGRAAIEGQATGLLASRLQIEDWYGRHPEIDEQEIVAPLFGLSLPRTGSTALSFLLAEDPRFRSLRSWESGQPAPPPEPETYASDPRIAATAAGMELLNQTIPLFQVMLPQSPTGPSECLQILALEFRSAVFGSLGDNRQYWDWFETCDMAPAYAYHRRVLKLLQWHFPTRPWRLKSPAHMYHIDELDRAYPDATFVMTHRDIAEVIPSVVSLLDVASAPLRDGPLAADFGTYEANSWERALRKTLRFRDAGNEARFFDIGFGALQSDPLGEIEALYAWTGVELTPEIRRRMEGWWAENLRRRRPHHYEAQSYGIDVVGLRRQFAFYNDRFAAELAPGR
jgi:Sulfotransferase family